MTTSKARHLSQIDARQQTAGSEDFQHRMADGSFVVDVHYADNFIPHDFVPASFEPRARRDVVCCQTTARRRSLVTTGGLKTGTEVRESMRPPFRHGSFDLHQ